MDSRFDGALPLRPPVFVGREAEITELQERLTQPGSVTYLQGMPGLGKTTLALEFAHRYRDQFEAVYWVPPGTSLDQLAHCRVWRCLLVLDNVEDEIPATLITGGSASVLVMTRRDNLAFLSEWQPVALQPFNELDCF